ncbi:MAG TPA: hypothetical protein VGF12_07130 [Roseateles sp.]|uniref:hypothetical protein n=1 Tax=Roseateles sp. TaxID=1971397 RepID=UPI002ED8A17D
MTDDLDRAPLSKPAGWSFSQIDDRTIRITDPLAPGDLVITLDDQAVAMRVLWRLASDLIAAPAAQQWLPIETAPTDGRVLLLGYFNAVGKWRTLRGEWMSADYIAENWENPDDGEPGWYETSVENDDVPNCWRTDPTHWLPLPASPGAAQPAATQAEPAAPVDVVLPPLPETVYSLFYEDEGDEDHGDEGYQEVLDEPGYTAKEMRDYARAAIAAAPAAASVPAEWREFVERVAKQKPEKPDHWSACSQCEHNISDAEDLLSTDPATAPDAQQQGQGDRP